MNWQEPVALGIVGLTALAFAWRPLRRRFGPRRLGDVLDTACGCSTRGSGGRCPPSVKVSGRRGERPRVEIR